MPNCLRTIQHVVLSNNDLLQLFITIKSYLKYNT